MQASTSPSRASNTLGSTLARKSAPRALKSHSEPVTTPQIDQRAYDLYRVTRARIKKRLATVRPRPTQIVTAAEQRQQARERVLDHMAEDVFESHGIILDHYTIKRIVEAYEEANAR